MARLTLDRVAKSFGDTRVVDDVSLTVEDGEFLAVLGPSGCGKTTLLRLIAGFEAVTAGSIDVGGSLMSDASTHVPPEHRRMGIVFQSYALWPHMSVADNVGYALKVQRAPRAEREKRVAAALETVGLGAYADRRPAQLSGGQRQRVALARCLAMAPSVVLLDEPLANLDVHLRASMQAEFAAFHKRARTTMIYVTHDQAEAMALADRIAVMEHGRLLQVAPPSRLYREPASAAVARFVGEGMILPATVMGGDGIGRCEVDIHGMRATVRCAGRAVAGLRGEVVLRAGGIALAAGGAGLPARISRLAYQGGGFRAEARLDAAPDLRMAIDLPEPSAVQEGDEVRLSIEDGWLLPETPVAGLAAAA